MRKGGVKMTRRMRVGSGQKGFALPAALVFALILLLVGTAVARKSLNANNEVMGITFRQAAANGGDRAMLLATNWLASNALSLTADNVGAGFYARERKDVDWTGLATPAVATDDVNWDGSNGAAALQPFTVPADGGDKSGNVYQYVIQRLCSASGPFTTTSAVSCMTYINTNIPSDYKQGELYNVSSITTATMLYYRITVRTYNTGTGSVSYTQSLMLVNT